MGPDRIVVLAGGSGALGELAAAGSSFEAVTDLDGCLARLRDRGPRVTLVAIGPDWPRPLSAAQHLREVDADVALAFVVPREDTEVMRAKLAFFPRAGDVTVVAAGGGTDLLVRRLDEAAAAARQRQRVRGALSRINRDLAGRAAEPRHRATPTSVSEHYLATLVRHAPDTIVSIDPRRRIVTINEAGQRTLGVEPESLEGRPLRELFADEDPGRLLDLVAAAERDEAHAEEEVPLQLRDGRELLLSATAAAIRDDVGTLAGLVIIARDVTAERRAEQRLRALQKAESLATLATGVAHDFNNLLVQAQGWADIARSDPDDRELVVAALEHIGHATRGAAELARAMLAYGGRADFQPRRLQLAALVEDLRPLLTAAVPAKITLRIEAGADTEISGDATQLRQIVLNLVANAAEAIGEAAGRVTVRTRSETSDATPPPTHGAARRAPATPYAIIEVEDTGPGIEPAVEQRLFDPFFTTKFTGRGLGLAASQGIARAHGGIITVEGRPGEGALFRVHLPATSETR